MPRKRESVPGAIADYPRVLDQFAQFVGNVKSLNIGSLVMTEIDVSDPSRVPMAFLGDRFLLRARMGVTENGHGMVFFECLIADVNGNFAPIKKCVVSHDGVVLFESSATSEAFSIAEGSRAIFNELVAAALPIVDIPSVKGFYRTMPPN
jgi:hypothetical protein